MNTPAVLPSVMLLFRKMLEIRYFEDEVQRLFTQNLVRGSTHLCQGQEGVAVGACSALQAGDTVTCTYRGHGVVLAAGAPLDRTMAEILGKANGLCSGKGGSMHLTCLERGVLGSFAIVGANIPVTVGAALSAQVLGTKAVSVAFFGDGATNIGTFHEALNLAAIWAVPAVFICENNLYGEYSHISKTTPVARLIDRASSYAMAAEQVDGNDVLAVRDAVWRATARARSGEGPVFIEALTYRHKGHSRTDPATYRPAAEVEEWLARDPIVLAEREILERAEATEGEVRHEKEEAQREVREALERALAWPEPDLAELEEQVFA